MLNFGLNFLIGFRFPLFCLQKKEFFICRQKNLSREFFFKDNESTSDVFDGLVVLKQPTSPHL